MTGQHRSIAGKQGVTKDRAASGREAARRYRTGEHSVHLARRGLAALTVFLLLLAYTTASAQPRVQARLEAVPQSGFYRLPLSPAFTAWCRPDLSDLRLRDSRGTTVAYVLDTVKNETALSYERCPLLEMRTDSVQSFIEMAVPPPGTGSLLLRFANTSARRVAHLSGSNDRRHWYSIAEHLVLAPTAVTETMTQQRFDFPFSHYPFLRLQVLNNGMDPMDILEAGYTGERSTAGNLQPVGSLALEQRDSADVSRLFLHNRPGLLLERLRFTVEGPPYFQRNSTLYAVRGDREVYVADFLLSSGQKELSFGALNDSLLLLEIDNGDNPPLRIAAVEADQQARFVLAWLEAGKSYLLQAGDPSARAPRYDLAAFRDTLPRNAPTLGYGAPEALAAAARGGAQRHTKWIWPALLAGIAVLALLTVSLLRDMKKKNT